MTAFELCSVYDDQKFMLKGGCVIWESITYLGHLDKCYISRVVTDGSIKGKPWFLGLRQLNRYISPDTIIKIINENGSNNKSKN